MTCIRLGITEENLQRILLADFVKVCDAVKSGSVELKHFSDVKVDDGTFVTSFIIRGKVEKSTPWERGEWWKYLDVTPTLKNRHFVKLLKMYPVLNSVLRNRIRDANS